MEIYQPHHSTSLEMQCFHSKDYVEFLSKINPSNQNVYEEEKYKYYVGQDCPIFENMFQFCQISSRGSVAGAKQLNHNLTDIAINWAAIVMQCGADFLVGDRLGCFNLEIKGHGKCVSYVKSLNTPLLILGGGRYTPRNVAKCWTYETALLTDNSDLSEKLPETEYTDYFGRNPNLFVLEIKNCHLNKNTKRYLEDTYKQGYENLRLLRGTPSVEMEISTNEQDLKLFDLNKKESMEDLDPDVRIHPLLWSKTIEPNNSFFEDPDLSLKYFVKSPILDPEISNENLFNFDYLLKEKQYFSKFKQPNLGLKRNFSKETLYNLTDSKNSLKISLEPDQKKKILNK
ncbi:histone deacetylase 3 [Anaeramoeba flamelloides]|uniref:Histone deacetylase 3 n=1 Tax=Anaeramoeba flamelloides TaxID=1746091 RepID=A0ABQ8YL85_9EUKA|nr:histone deacetylase 3 [Anaeramoeba flamelloides]